MIDYLVKCPSDPYENTNCFGDLDRAWDLCLSLLKSTDIQKLVITMSRDITNSSVTTVSTDYDEKNESSSCLW